MSGQVKYGLVKCILPVGGAIPGKSYLYAKGNLAWYKHVVFIKDDDFRSFGDIRFNNCFEVIIEPSVDNELLELLFL